MIAWSVVTGHLLVATLISTILTCFFFPYLKSPKVLKKSSISPCHLYSVEACAMTMISNSFWKGDIHRYFTQTKVLNSSIPWILALSHCYIGYQSTNHHMKIKHRVVPRHSSFTNKFYFYNMYGWQQLPQAFSCSKCTVHQFFDNSLH